MRVPICPTMADAITDEAAGTVRYAEPKRIPEPKNGNDKCNRTWKGISLRIWGTQMTSDAWEYEPTEESPEEEDYAPQKFEIVNYPADITLKGYLEQWRSGQLNVPAFQRDYVWDVKKASRLIESLILGLPVPGVFLYRPKGSNHLQIVDGQQRILSLIKFQDEKFDDKSIFRLKDVQPELEGKRFSDLTEDVRFKFETSVLRATIIQQLSPDDDTSVYQIFERLNTGGVNLNPMEIRQSVSYGPFVDVLKSMNMDADWQTILGRSKPDKRLRDVELVLRCLAFFQHRTMYEKPMKEFLNSYMEFKRKNDSDFDDLENNFAATTEIIVKALGAKPFHVWGRLNYAVLDSVVYAVMAHNDPVDKFKEKFDALIQDPAYVDAVRFNTSDSSSIETRLSKAAEYLV